MEILKDLQKLYPKIFPANEFKLLKIGINRDIRQDAQLKVSSKELARFFYWYCNTKDYVLLHNENSPRYDLQGEIKGLVTDEQIKSKNKELEKIKSRIRKVFKSKQDQVDNMDKKVSNEDRQEKGK